jgi:ankyrin repeat protein
LKKYWILILLALSICSQNSYGEDIAYLMTASSKGDIETVKAMLKSGVNPNTKDHDDITALMYAARKNRTDVATFLISKGADINAKDSGGWTPLMLPLKKIMSKR